MSEERQEVSKVLTIGGTSNTPHKSPMRWPWIAASVILAVALVVVIFQNSRGGSEVVATINSTKITKNDLYDEMKKKGGTSTLNGMIQIELVNQAAKKANVTITSADIDAEIEDFKKQLPSPDQLESMLAQYGMTMEDFRNEMETQVKIEKILEPEITITEDAMKKYYDENKATYDTPEEVRASHILVPTKEEADAILKQLKEGGDFAAIAKEKNTDSTKDTGGDLGFFSKDKMLPEFSEAAFKLNKDQLSEPVKTQYGYHIIKVTDKKAAVASTYDSVKDQVKKTLFKQEVQSKSSEWMQKITSEAKIDNKLESASASDAK